MNTDFEQKETKETKSVIERKTIFSEDREYRYTLWREWGVGTLPLMGHQESPESYVQFIGLNPSTADEVRDDPTIRRCIGFAKAWGFGALCMTNAFAFRATLPTDMKREEDPVGMANNNYLIQIGQSAGLVVAAWGKDGAFRERQDWVKKMFFDCDIKLHHLGLNGDGTPKHPLYLRKDTLPRLWI